MINNTIEYKGYVAQLRFDWKDVIIVGEVINTNAVIAFHADSIGEVKEAFEEMVDTYIEACEAEGIPVSRPYSGRFNLRLSPDLHKELSVEAGREGVSLNDITIQLLQSGLHHKHYMENQASQTASHP